MSHIIDTAETDATINDILSAPTRAGLQALARAGNHTEAQHGRRKLRAIGRRLNAHKDKHKRR